MSLIQNIRDRGGLVSAIIIAIALLGFILMDAFSSRSNLFSNNSTALGSVNGAEIDYIEFEKKVTAAEDYQQSQGQAVGEEGRQQILENTWNQEVNQIIMKNEFEKLGLYISDNELNDILFGSNPPEDLRQRFTDPNTGIYDAAAARRAINEAGRSKEPGAVEQMNQYLASMELTRMFDKYTALMSKSINYPKWFIEKQNADNSQIARISYIVVPYSSIPDSSIKVTDKEIEDYIEERKDDFKQTETRSFSYVVFNAAPTAADSAEAREQVASLKSEFANATDPAIFLNRYSSGIKDFDFYAGESQMQMEAKDSIQAMAPGQIIGPYLDGGSYALAKMLDKKNLPDSVYARHILARIDPNTGMTDSVAEKRIDSAIAAIAAGARFDSVMFKASDDQGANMQEGGIMKFSSQQMQDKNQFDQDFAKFVFLDGKKGERKKIKTQFGWHYIEIVDQKGIQPHYKVAYYTKPIQPSPDTDRNANNEASSFAGNSRTEKEFQANVDKNLKPKGINSIAVPSVSPMQYQIPGIGASRQLIKAVYDADKGDVVGPLRVGDAYVVAVVTEVNEEGTTSVSSARSYVEPVLRNRKKADQIIKRVGKVSTLEAASTSLGQPIQVADSLRFDLRQNMALGNEFRMIGAAFNPANAGKVVPEPVEGMSGVYVLRVESVSAMPVDANIEEQRRSLRLQAEGNVRNGQANPSGILFRAADIKDQRARFY